MQSMREPFDARSHIVELSSVRQLMVIRAVRIMEVGGDPTHVQDHLASLDAVMSLLCGRCSVSCLHERLGGLLANGRQTITHAELFKLLKRDDDT